MNSGPNTVCIHVMYSTGKTLLTALQVLQVLHHSWGTTGGQAQMRLVLRAAVSWSTRTHTDTH
jgi:hypothetical protein